MNRIIKFRYWDNIEGRMATPGQSEVFYTAMLIEQRKLERERYVFQQFTGLLDKNGKEIYEGDVVLIPSIWHETILDDGSGPDENSNQLVEVEMVDGCFGCVMQADSLFENRFYSMREIKKEVTDEPIEVIGNIYENPELITK